MSFWDFTKKKELAIIEQLKNALAEKAGIVQEQENTIQEQENRIISLSDNIKGTEQTIRELHRSLSKYSTIIDIDRTIEDKLKACDIEVQNRQQTADKLSELISDLDTKYTKAYTVYTNLQKQIGIYTDNLDMADFGMYAPHFNFDDAESYKAKIIEIREQQKALIKNESAVVGGDNITWNGSLSQGQAMVKRQKKLMLRAFNGECDSFVANVDWNNVDKMTERILKSFDAINKVYEKQDININIKYQQLKLDELRCAFEYKNKKHEEREEQRAIREQMREEEKARREIEVAIIKAQKEEETYQRALEKARNEIATLVGDKHAKMQAKIEELEARVAEAKNNGERALSMAQQTKRGHVYVISNIGSFGENVYKIGMTRRLDPMDRVRELGDASVPFPFDVHAIIFCEDAPTMENELHRHFDAKRLNKINPRKEFFNVTLSEIEDVVHEHNATIEFTQIAEARDYRETKSIEAKITQQQNTTHQFSANLFDNN